MPCRLVGVPLDQGDVGDPAQRFGVLGLERQHLRVARVRGGELLALDVHCRERQERLREARVLADGLLEHRGRLCLVPRLAQVVAQHHRVLGGERAALLELAQVAHRVLRAAGCRVGDGPRAQHHEHAGVLGEQRRQLADRLLRLGAGDRHAVAPQARTRPMPSFGSRPVGRGGEPPPVPT